MNTMIPSAQLDAIARLELATDALQKALRAVPHPELQPAGGAIVAPSGLKHLDDLHTTLRAIDNAIQFRSSAHKPQPDHNETSAEADTAFRDLLLTDEENRVAESVTLRLTTDLATALTHARAQLAHQPSFAADPEFASRVLDAALADGSRLGRRIYKL